MNETFKKFTEEIKAAISSQFQTKEIKDFIATTKAAEDAGSFEVVISTADTDRQGESIDQNGWDLSFYQTNPVVLWAHDYHSLPIGVSEGIIIKDGKLIATGKFAPESANPFAQQVRRLYDLKIIRATSVGFIMQETNGKVITKAQLLEFSFVPVPANPYALSLSQVAKIGLDLAMLKMKGIEISAKQDEPKEGDLCTLEDGSEGLIVEGNCVANEAKAEGDSCTMEDGTEGEMKPDAEGNLVCAPKIEEKPEKGAVSSEADLVNQRHAKWEKLDGILNIVDAFIGVYLDEKTSTEDFDKLLAETITLIQKFLPEGVKAEGEKVLQSIGKRYYISGETIKSNKALPQKGSEGEVKPDGVAPKQRSSCVGQDEKEDLELFLLSQSVLRVINNATSEALMKFNKRTRANSHGRKIY